MEHEFQNDECEYCTAPPTEVRNDGDRILELCELCAEDFDEEHDEDEPELDEDYDDTSEDD